MNIYLIITGAMQFIMAGDNTNDLYFKYPETVIAIIKLDDDTINQIKELP